MCFYIFEGVTGEYCKREIYKQAFNVQVFILPRSTVIFWRLNRVSLVIDAAIMILSIYKSYKLFYLAVLVFTYSWNDTATFPVNSPKHSNQPNKQWT